MIYCKKCGHQFESYLKGPSFHCPSCGERLLREIDFLSGKQWERERLADSAPALLEACRAAVAYDDAIRACADDPDEMSSYCTAQGDTLDMLYDDWMTKARAAIAAASADGDDG